MTPTRALATVLLALLSSSSPARADDWLALHPECAFDPEVVAPGHMVILYPRAGLPAVVQQGERLVTRVRVPSGLTPPPGIQQDRALVGWSSELVGYGVPMGGRVAHRYPLRVVDVRPDGPSSLVYRAAIVVPRWAAPGTYALRMTAPGGADVVAGAVRVIGHGEEPRVALLGPVELGPGDPGEALARLSARLGRAPVDAWIAPQEPHLRAALENAPLPDGGGAGSAPPPPILLLPATEGGLPVALRLGDEVLVLGQCDGRFVHFDEELAALVHDEGRTARRLAAADLPDAGRARLLPDDRATSIPIPPDAAAITRAPPDALSVTVPEGGYAAELTVLLPDDGRATVVEGTTPGLWPATPVADVATVPSVAARLHVEPGTSVRLRRAAPSPLSLSIDVDPARAETGIPVQLAAEPSREAALVAWQLDEDVTAVGNGARRGWAPLGPHRVWAVAIAPDGVAARAETTVQVVTREKSTCDCRAAPGAPGAPAITVFLPLLGIVVCRVRRARNIRAPGRRSQP